MTVSWVPVPPGSPFGPATLPYGVFSVGDKPPRVGVAIGDHVIDLAPLAAADGLDRTGTLAAGSLAPFMALGRRAWTAVRDWLTRLVTDESFQAAVSPHLLARGDVALHPPFPVGDYVDFYSSEHHATNVGRILRPGTDPLPPSWRHLPIGYHGRSGTVVPSGTPIVRPCGQHRAPGADSPTYGPTTRLDIEAEIGFVVGVPSRLGVPIPVRDFGEHVFGVVLVNDWSARDLQAWEYVPLGPFLGKSFATTISHWVVPLQALEAARLSPPRREPEPLPYLRDDPRDPWGLDIDLEVTWNGNVVARPPFRHMYWTPAQQLAHLTSNGASVRTGDLYASGTVSGPKHDQRGSFLELSWNGTQPVQLADGTNRTFLEDGDVVTITASAPGPDSERVGFGEVTGTVLPAACRPS